jgi:hypothetical protein
MLDVIKAIGDYLREEGRVIREAPLAFAIGCLLIGSATFGAVEWHFSGRLDLQHDTIENQRNRIEQLQGELKGAAPGLAALQARRAAVRQHLLELYVSAGPLTSHDVNWPDNVSMDNAVKELDLGVKKWENETATWLEQTLGVAAKERFLDIGICLHLAIVDRLITIG